jgi:PmbA protein
MRAIGQTLERLGQRAAQAEVLALESEATRISFEANQVKSAAVEETQGLALRAMVDGRLGFTAAAGPADEDELIDAVVASARFGEQLPIAFPGAAAAAPLVTYDPALAEIPLTRFVEIGREIVAQLRAVDDHAQVNVDIERDVQRMALHNSAGAAVSLTASAMAISVSVERVRGDDVLIVYDAVSGVSFSEDYREMVARLADKLALGNRAATLASGRLPVLFSPAGAAVLWYPLLMAVNGENVQRGTSPLSQRLGQAVFDPALTVWDDPTLPGRPASAPYDDEGVPTRRKALIDKGACAGFIYDLKTAALSGVESTGNGARGLFSPPSPAVSNLTVAPGERSLDEIVAGIDHGLLVDGVLGLGQGNIMSGAFSNSVGLGFLIEGGEIVGRVKDVAIAGNIYQDLRSITALSRETQWVHGRISMPSVLLPEIKVVARGGAAG